MAQDRQQRPRERPRPPTEDHEVMGRSPTILQDHVKIIGHRKIPTILQDDFAIVSHRKTTHIGPRCPAEALQLDDRPAIEKVEEKIQRQTMLTVSFGPEDKTT